MKESDPAFLKLKYELESVYIDLYRLQQKDPEKYAGKIAELKGIAAEIKHRMALYKTKKAVERGFRKGR